MEISHASDTKGNAWKEKSISQNALKVIDKLIP
jgi:hypothetical protein